MINYFKENYKNLTLEFFLSILSSFIIIIGRSIYNNHSFSLLTSDLVTNIFYFIILTILSTIALRTIYILTNKIDFKLNISNKFIYLILFIVLFIIYFICYFSYYPGIQTHDSYHQVLQVLGIRPLINHHPILHTFVIKICIDIAKVLGNYLYAINIYSLFQMSMNFLFYIYTFFWLKKKKVNDINLVFVILYFISVPIFHLMSFYMTKDILFSFSFTVFMMKLYDSIENEKDDWTLYLFGIISCLLRNNFVYALVLSIVLLFIFKYSYKTIKVLFIISITTVITTNILYPSLGIQKSLSKEALSVPMSQIANSYNLHPNNVDNEILKFIPDIENYNYRFADTIKNTFDEDYYNNNKKIFWNIYLENLIKYPFEYISSFLDLNIPSWYPFSRFPDPHSNRMFIETFEFTTEHFPITRQYFNETTHYLYEQVANNNLSIMKFPLINFFFSISFPFWFFFVSLYLSIKNQSKNSIALLIICFSLYFTHLLGPVSNFRYNTVYYYFFPILLLLVIKKRKS